MEEKLPKYKCIRCKKDFEYYMHSNFNLGLCQECLNELEESGKITRDEWVDNVTHSITCPKCGRHYLMIVDNKCDTPDCNVWFFWDELDCKVFARWIKSDDEIAEEKKDE